MGLIGEVVESHGRVSAPGGRCCGATCGAAQTMAIRLLEAVTQELGLARVALAAAPGQNAPR